MLVPAFFFRGVSVQDRWVKDLLLFLGFPFSFYLAKFPQTVNTFEDPPMCNPTPILRPITAESKEHGSVNPHNIREGYGQQGKITVGPNQAFFYTEREKALVGWLRLGLPFLDRGPHSGKKYLRRHILDPSEQNPPGTKVNQSHLLQWLPCPDAAMATARSLLGECGG